MCTWHHHGCATLTFFLWNELKAEVSIQTSYHFSTGDRVLNAQCLVETTTVYAFRHVTDVLMVIKMFYVGPIASCWYVFTVH